MACGRCFVLLKRDSSSPRPVDQLDEDMSAQPGSGRLSLGKARRRVLQGWNNGKGSAQVLDTVLNRREKHSFKREKGKGCATKDTKESSGGQISSKTIIEGIVNHLRQHSKAEK